MDNTEFVTLMLLPKNWCCSEDGLFLQFIKNMGPVKVIRKELLVM